MKQLTKECIELIENRGNFNKRTSMNYIEGYLDGSQDALTTPSIYKAAGLTEATPLTDEELEKNTATHYSLKSMSEISQQDEARKMGSGWVSVEDELPKTNATHWIYLKEIHRVFTGMFDPYSKKWFHDYGNAVVTHWAKIHIPPPPKEK